MEKIEQRYFARDLIVVAVIAEFFSSFTLWLIESSIKYPLFIIETLSIIMIYVVLSNYDFRFTLKQDLTRRISPVLLLDIILIYFASVLIVLNQFNITESTTRLVLAFVCTSGLSGYALLNVCGVTKYFSKLEILILSCIASFILSGFCTLVLLWSDESIRSIVIPFVFILLGIGSFLKHLKIKDVSTFKIRSLCKNIDILAITICIAFYAVSFYILYPNLTNIVGTDISRHFQETVILSRTPDLYGSFAYLLFHAFGSTLYILSGSITRESFQIIQITLGFLLPLTIYVFAKRFLVDIDRRIPAISAMFYAIFASLSFIYLAKLKASGSTITEFYLLQNVAERAYNGTVYFAQPFMWFVPPTINFIMFIIAFVLLRISALPRSKFIPMYTVLILAMYLTHASEATIFVLILGIYSMFSKSKSLRFDDALLSSLIAFIISALVLVYTQIFWPSMVRDPHLDLPSVLAVMLPVLLVGITMFWRHKIIHRIHLPIKFIINKKFYQVLSTILVAIYIIGSVTWYFDDNFKTSLVDTAGTVPWFIYPLSLGIVGLLTVIAIWYLGDILPNSSVAVLFGSIALLLLLGNVISFVNLHFFFTGYFEKRFPALIFLFACLLAPIPLIKLVEQARVKRKFFVKIGFSVIISLIVLVGFSSSILVLEYWHLAGSSLTMTQEESQAITYFGNLLQHDSRAQTFAPSSYSANILTFATSPYSLSNPKALINSVDPGTAFYLQRAHDLPHMYIYVHTRDSDILKEGSWFTNHLLRTSPIVFSNNKVTIYNATHVSFPRSNSDTIMLVPTDPNVIPEKSLFYAYDVISKHDRNYTVMFDKDQNALRAKTAVLSYDPPENNNQSKLYDVSSLNSWRIISGNWKYSTDGLHGEDVLENQTRIILSPLSSNYFTLDTSFRILDANQKLPDYVSIVHSWTDTNNYKLAEIAFVSKHVYVSFQTIKDGKVYTDSAWPGKATGLSWAPGNLFNVTFSKQGKFEELFFNGTKYLHQNDLGQPGYIGLEHTRTHVVFDHININKFDKSNVREPLDYISYVKSGGNLVVLNTNGYGSISDILFNVGSSSYKASKIMMPSGDSLSVDSIVLPTSAAKNVRPLAFYVSPENKSSILIADETIGLGKIRYVNIFPIITSFDENKISATVFQEVLDKISYLIDLHTLNPEPHKINSNVNFKEMDGSGNVTIKTRSLVFPLEQFVNVTVRNHDKTISIANVTTLKINSYQNATLHTNQIVLSNGKGLYGNLVLGNSLEAFFENNATLDVISNNSNSYHFDNVSNISLQNGSPIDVYAWQPWIKVDGTTYFSEFNGPSSFANTLTGQDITVSGKVSLNLFMSDTYTYGNNITRSIEVGLKK